MDSSRGELYRYCIENGVGMPHYITIGLRSGRYRSTIDGIESELHDSAVVAEEEVSKLYLSFLKSGQSGEIVEKNEMVWDPNNASQWKNVLQEYRVKHKYLLPQYESESKPDYRGKILWRAWITGFESLSSHFHPTLKLAESQTAFNVYMHEAFRV